MFTHKFESEPSRRHVVPAAWGAGAVASVVLVLGVNGTLSSWTQAVINNDTNTTKSTVAVALEELSGTTSCVDTAGEAGNTATCSTINKYGGTVLDPDGTNTSSQTVTLKNTGTTSGDLTLSAGTCAATLVSDSSVVSAPNLCGLDTVEVTCGTTPTIVFATGTLDAFEAGGSQTVATLAAGDSLDCTFLVTLPADALATYSDQQASQPLTWTLTKS